jgi:hypothetical protein
MVFTPQKKSCFFSVFNATETPQALIIGEGL